MTSIVRDKIRTAELVYIMRMCLQLIYENKVHNTEMWMRVNVTRSITRALGNKIFQLYGHVNKIDETKWPRKIF